MADVIVHLRSIRIEADEAVVNAFFKGNETAQAQIYLEVEEKLKEVMAPDFIGDGLIEDMEIEEFEEESEEEIERRRLSKIENDRKFDELEEKQKKAGITFGSNRLKDEDEDA